MGLPEYSPRMLADYQAIQLNSDYREATRRLHGDSLLAQLKQEFPRMSAPGADDIISIAFRIEQIAIRILPGPNASQEERREAKSAFETAAKLFEQVAESQLISSQGVNLDLYFHSAVDYSLGEFQANATVLARKVLERFDFGDDPHAQLLRAAFLLLKRDLLKIPPAFSTSSDRERFDERSARLLANDNTPQGEVAETLAHKISHEAINAFSDYLRVGDDDLFTVAQAKIKSALAVCNGLRDPDNYILVQLIALLIRQMHFSSLWQQLGTSLSFRDNPILLRYIKTLTSDRFRPVYELWDSQVAALPKVLDTSSSLVLQMPTSAGKTRIAEVKIIHTLANGPPSTKCIYVAPFKSLAGQVEEALSYSLTRVGYRVASIFGSYESIDLEDLVTESTDVLVITPEKLDYLLRVNKDIFADVRLIVIDEGHILDNNVRGLRLEMLVQRIIRSFSANPLQVMLISAVVPNGEEIAAWLAQGEPMVATSQWKPTKLRQGIFYWTKDWEGRIRYPEERMELLTGITRRLVRAYHKTRPGIPLKKPIYYPEGGYDIAIELSLSLLKASPTIIFTAVRRHVDSIAANLHRRVLEQRAQQASFHLLESEKQQEAATLAARIERRLGVGFPLAAYVREGFGYHHGMLPDDIRSAVEEAFREELLRVLIATPTLAQGVNLPVHLMIVANLERGSGSPFLIRDFRNIAGRAGRALHETEGHVVFVQNTQSSWLVDQMYRYLRDDRNEAVQSTLFALYAEILKSKLGVSLAQFLANPQSFEVTDEDTEDPTDLAAAFQTQILAMLYEGLINEDNLESVRTLIDRSLLGSQWKADRSVYEPLIAFAGSHTRYVSRGLTTQGQKQAYYRTGLGLTSCQRLEAAIRELAREGHLATIRDPATGSLDPTPLQAILQLVAVPRETNSLMSVTDKAISAMIRWMNYADIADLIDEFKDQATLFTDPLRVADMIGRLFMNDGPWALNAVVKILAYLGEQESIQFDPEIAFLPGYAKYGVNTPVAAYVCGLGIPDRGVANDLSRLYYTRVGPDGLMVGLAEFQEWAMALTFEDVARLVQDQRLARDVWSAIGRHTPSQRPIELFEDPRQIRVTTYLVGLQYEGRLDHIGEVGPGDVLPLVREPDNPFDAHAMAVTTPAGNKLGYIRRSKALPLSILADEGIPLTCRVREMHEGSPDPARVLLLEITAT